ncbi:uncharacterized protein PG998_008982 [Apiospora kogelbergensis]|uniref:Uncharacterized protein n=1 Tax=Apiospora kogelbergensis TaxID=1337665 RepID=A0AAW0R6F5_9PEZI
MSASKEYAAQHIAGQTQNGATGGSDTERGPKFRLSPQISIGCSPQTNDFKPHRTFMVTQDPNSQFQLEVSVQVHIKGILHDTAFLGTKQKDEEEVILDCGMHLAFDMRFQGDQKFGPLVMQSPVQSTTSQVEGTLEKNDAGIHARAALQSLDDLPSIAYQGLISWYVKSQVHQMMLHPLRKDFAEGGPLDIYELYTTQAELQASMQRLNQNMVLSVITSGFHDLRDISDEYLRERI